MTGDVDHVIHAPRDPVIAVRVPAAPVPGKVVALVVAEIGLLEPLVIAPDRAHLAWPAVSDTQNPLHVIALDLGTGGGFKYDRFDPEERLHRGAGFGGVGTGQRRHQVTAGFRLPPCVHDRAVPFAHNVIVPIPGFGVDRLAHGAKQFQAAEIAAVNKGAPLAHQRANGGRGGVELIYLVFFTDLPKAAGVGVGGHAFEHERCGPVGKRTVDDIAVARHPAHIGRAPIDIAIVVIKRDLVGQRGIDQIATRRMHDPFGLTGRARGIEDEQRIFGVHLFRRASVRSLFFKRGIIHVARIIPRHITASAPHHQTFDRWVAACQSLVRVGLQRCRFAPAGRIIRGDHNLGVRPLNPCRQRIRREPGEDDRMDRTDARAGQHGIGGFGDHRHVDDNPVAFADADIAQDIGHFTRLGMQGTIADVLRLFVRAVRLPDDRGLVAARFKMTVDAIGADVQRTVGKPVDLDLTESEIDVFDLGKRLHPVDALRLLQPEPFGVRDRGMIHRVVFRGVHMGIGRHVVGWRIGLCGDVGHGSSLRTLFVFCRSDAWAWRLSLGRS